MPLVTTFIPTFNRASLLKKAIESVLSQTFQDFSVIVLDNASTDNTAEVVNSFCDLRVHYFRQKENVGLFQNFATALSKVNTEYFSFLSDDDHLLPCFYETALADFAQYPDAGFVATQTLTINGKKEITASRFPSKGYFTKNEAHLLTAYTLPPWTSILFHKKVLKKIPRFNSQVYNAFDTEFILKCIAFYPFVFNPTVCAYFTQWKESASSVNSGVKVFWPHFMNAVESALDAGNFSNEVTHQLRTYFLKQSKTALRTYWMRGMRMGDEKEMLLAEQALREIRKDDLARFLGMLRLTSKRIPFFHHLLISLNALKNRIRARKTHDSIPLPDHSSI